MTTKTQLTDALHAAAETIGSLMDFVGESNAIRMVGAREAYAEAAALLDSIYALLDREAA